MHVYEQMRRNNDVRYSINLDASPAVLITTSTCKAIHHCRRNLTTNGEAILEIYSQIKGASSAATIVSHCTCLAPIFDLFLALKKEKVGGVVPKLPSCLSAPLSCALPPQP